MRRRAAALAAAAGVAAALLAACSSASPSTSGDTVPPTSATATTAPPTTGPPTTSLTTTTEPQTLPRVVTSATPPGWVAIAYGKLQVSVPAGWLVETAAASVCGSNAGMVFLGDASGLPPPTGCALAEDRVSLVSLRGSVAHGTAERVNGVEVVTLRRSADQIAVAVPSLGVAVTATGPTAARVIATISPAPLAVIEAPGPAPAVPTGWQTAEFGPLRLAVPARWGVRRTGWPWCDDGPVEATLWFGRFDTPASEVEPPCAPPYPTALTETGRDGVLVAEGPYEPLAQRSAAPCFAVPELTVCTTGAGGTAIGLAVTTRTGAHAYVEIGLAGDGILARTILYSLRPA